jgi:drug/metabolite transporter (DMT)-like permease
LPPNQRAALGWLSIGIVMFATMDASAKWLGRTYPLTAAVWIRYLIPTLLIGSYLVATRGRKFAHAPQPAIQILRGILLVLSTLCFWTALSHLPLLEAVTVSFICPTMVVIFSALLLRERPLRAHWIALVMGFVGVLIALRPGLLHAGVGAVAALSSAAFYALYLVLTRRVADQADALVLLFHGNAIGALALTLIAPATARMPTILAEWLILPALGLCGAIGHWCMIKAYARADAATLAPFMYAQLLVATFYGWLIYDNLPDGFTLLGMLVILASGLYVLHAGRRVQQQALLKSRATEVAATPE